LPYKKSINSKVDIGFYIFALTTDGFLGATSSSDQLTVEANQSSHPRQIDVGLIVVFYL